MSLTQLTAYFQKVWSMGVTSCQIIALLWSYWCCILLCFWFICETRHFTEFLNCTLVKLERCHFVTDALKMDGDDVMVDIYESVQDELRTKNKQLAKEKQKVCN